MSKDIDVYYNSSGRILAMALQIESRLEQFISLYFLTKKTEKNRFFREAVLSVFSFEDKVKIFQRICKQEQYEKKKLNAICKHIRQVQELRNKIAHWELVKSNEGTIFFANKGVVGHFVLTKKTLSEMEREKTIAVSGINHFETIFLKEGTFDTRPGIQIHDNNWNDFYREVQAFVIKNDELPASSSETAREKILGKWCFQQRQARKEGKLSDDKIQSLNLISGWFWKREDIWDIRYEQLKLFIDKYHRYPQRSDINRVHSFVSKRERRLNVWWMHIKQLHTGTRNQSKLTPEQIRKMELLPGWFWDGPEKWNLKFVKLKKYVEKHQRLPRWSSKSRNEHLLAVWCNLQRQTYKGQRLHYKLTSEQITQLESLTGWFWKKKTKDVSQ